MVRTSPYDRALELCPDAETKAALSRIAAELNLGASSPEWIVVVLHAEARRLFPPAPTNTEPQVTQVESPKLDEARKAMSQAAEQIEASAKKIDGTVIDVGKIDGAMMRAARTTGREIAAQFVPTRDLVAFLLGAFAAIALAYAVPAFAGATHFFSGWLYVLAVALGVSGTLAYLWIGELLRKRR